MTIIVPARGPQPADVLLVGEAPGRTESERLEPFVGASGQEQSDHLRRHGIDVRTWRRANIIGEYTPGNPDPTPEQIARWTPRLLSEIDATRPRLIVAVGRFAARWFLGELANLDIVHGMPYRAGAFDSSRVNRAPADCIIVPTYHPAWGLRNEDPKSMARALIAEDYAAVARIYYRIMAGETITPIYDEYAGREQYEDVTGEQLELYLHSSFYVNTPLTEIGLDTEGTPNGGEWSLQISPHPGVGYVLRLTQPDFSRGIAAVQRLVNRGCTIVTHQASTPSGAMYDTRMCRGMGLELRDARIWDTMDALYMLRLESQGLKLASARWTGAYTTDYESLIGDIGREKQITYLEQIISRRWPKPQQRLIEANDGTCKLYKPNPVEKTVDRLLCDLYINKPGRKGEPIDIPERWRDIDHVLRKMVEAELGQLPEGTIADVPLADAIQYAGRDPDITLRLKHKLAVRLAELGPEYVQLHADHCNFLRIIEEMQYNGMPASRPHFQRLYDDLAADLAVLQAQISHRYFSGKPFNPKSPPQTAILLRRRGLEGAKKTKKGAISTGKKSIEHLKSQDDAVRLLFEWRERQHLRDMFCKPTLEMIPEDVDIHNVRGAIKPTTIPTRRLAMEDPNLLAIPVRTDIGRKVRGCYIIPPDSDEVFIAVDLSQIELRVMADMSGDTALCSTFNSGLCPHKATASAVFGVPYEQVDPFNHRLPAKTINFGAIYGQQAQGMRDQLRSFGLIWSDEECEKFRREVFKLYKQMAQYIDDVTKDVSRTVTEEIRLINRHNLPHDSVITTSGQASSGLVWDYWGMRRYVPNAVPKRNAGRSAVRNNKDYEARKLQAEAAREAVNHTIQGTAQGMLQKSTIWLDPRIRDIQREGINVKWRLTVHDELILTCPQQHADGVMQLVSEGLTKHCGIRLSVPVEAEGKMAKTWSDLK